MEVEVVRRFIHDDDMRSRQEHLREGDFGTFSAREGRDGLMPFLILYQETSEHRAYFLVFFMVLTQLFHDSGFGIEICEDL